MSDYDTHKKVRPPLRTKDDRAALWEGLQDGTIDCIATDHAPHSAIEKEVEFERAAPGMIGLETALPLALRLVKNKVIDLKKLIWLMSTRPAELLHLPGGHLEIGTNADIVIFDPAAHWKIDPGKFRSKSRNSPFGGWQVTGQVRWTLVGGQIVYDSAPRP